MKQVPTQRELLNFTATIHEYFKAHGRSFPWREEITPYHVVVSEVMLQQTQTDRVAQKFNDFISAFPHFESLASAPFELVLRSWKGLGYNRRALNLQKIAQLVMDHHGGTLPDSPATLKTFPGIGPATAASICAFAFNQPTLFIETNIRTVFIYFFFRDQQQIHDRQIMPLIEHTIDQKNPRLWYYALMDYGVMLKKTVGNLCQQSKHYAKQSRFEGSDRQIRGKILELLLKNPHLSDEYIMSALTIEKNRYDKIVGTLVKDGFLRRNAQAVSLIQNL